MDILRGQWTQVMEIPQHARTVAVICLMVSVALGMTALTVHAQATAFDYLNLRVSGIEALNIDRRLSVLESNMSELTWISRTVAAAVVGHLTLAISGFVSGRKRT